MEILKCEGVRKVYGSGNNQVVALDRSDLTVNKGEFVAIIGASGSGKSTLLHILGSVDQPTEGKVIVEGTDISTMNRTQAAIFRRRKVGLVYQFYNLIPTLTSLTRQTQAQSGIFSAGDTVPWHHRQAGSSSEPVIRRPAAARGHCQIFDLPPCPSAGGRAHRQPGSEEFQGNH